MRVAIALIVFSITALYADFIRVEMGGGIWIENSSGEIQHRGDAYPLDFNDELGLDESRDIYLWAFLKQPIPIIPNVRLEYLKSEQDGKSDSAFIWHKVDNYPQDTPYKIALEQIDAALYYNLLDNLFWTTLDLGLDAKFINADYTFGTGSSLQNDSEQLIVPMLYGRGRVQIPASGFGAEADVKYFAYSQSQVADVIVKLDYTFDSLLIRPSVELGYRLESIDCSRSDFSIDSDMDLLISGLFAGVAIRY